jgi:hypothetical protein
MEKFTKYPELNLLIKLIIDEYKIAELNSVVSNDENKINKKQEILDLLHDINVRLPWISEFHQKEEYVKVDTHVAKAAYNLSKILKTIYNNNL